MKCPKCQFENPDEMKFCGECGAKIEIFCSSCNFSNPPQFKFCGECGHKLSPELESPPKDQSFDEKLEKIQRYLPKGLTEKILSQRDRIEGERKQVTVMFCDMEGFTSLSEKLGPEEAYSTIDKVYEILIHKVHDFEGTVNEMTGDGIVALFGAPIALEDAPQRAIRSALAIHREMVKFSETVRDKNQTPAIKMRIGIHTGPVVVGTVGNDLRVEFKAVGDTVNLASRIEEIAEPGTTYITEETFKLTEGVFRFEGLGAHEIKGKETPVKIYQVLAPSTLRTRFDVSSESGLTPFVGRERELEILLDGLQRTKTGRGQAISIIAEAGVGKSRLLYEFRKAIANENVTFLEGKCLSYSRNVAYHPVIDILKSNYGIRDGDGDFEVREKVKRGLEFLEVDEDSTLPYLLELLLVKNGGLEDLCLSPEDRKERIIEALNRIVLKGSEIHPLIIAIEDLHWIDKSSEDRFKSLLDCISGARVFLIFTYRPEYIHTWSGKSYHSQITLNQLSNRESLALIAHLLGTENIDGALEDLILEKTEGIPFFIEAFVKSLKDLKIITKEDGKYLLAKDIEAFIVPSTVHDVIMARVDSLPKGAKEVLQTGSVIEREFRYELIKQVTELPEQELLSNLSVLKDSELLYERGIYPQSTYIFKHALTQEVVYNSLLLKRRKEIHEKIGRSIEMMHKDRLEEFYETLAHQYSLSANSKKAYQYLKLSGNKATRNNSLNEAFSFYKKAIDVLHQMPDDIENKREEIETRLLLAMPIRLLGYPNGSLQILEEGERLSKELGDEKSYIAFHGKLGHFYAVRGELELAREHAENAFKIAEDTQDVDLVAPITIDLCGVCIVAGYPLKIAETVPKVLDIIEKMGRESEFFGMRYNVYSALLSFLGQAFSWLGNFEEGVRRCEKGRHFGYMYKSTYGMGWVEFCFGCLYELMGDGKEAIEHFIQSIGYLERAKGFLLLGNAWSRLGFGYLLLGDLDNALRHIQKGLKIQNNMKIPYYESTHYLYLSDFYLASGDLKNAQDCIKRALKLSRKNQEKQYEGISLILLGRIMSKKDASVRTKAAECIREGIKLLDELEIKPYCAQGYLFLGEHHIDEGRGEEAVQNLKKAKAMFKQMRMLYWSTKTQEVLERL